MNILQIIVSLMFMIRGVIVNEAVSGCEILYFPLLLLSGYKIWKSKEKSIYFVGKELFLLGVIGVFLSYIAALATRQEQEYGILFLFHYMLGHTDKIFPNMLWIFPTLLESFFLYWLLEKYIGNTKIRYGLAGLGVLSAVLWMVCKKRMLPFYLNMVMIGVAILMLADVLEKIKSQYFSMEWKQSFCIGGLFLIIACKMGEISAYLSGGILYSSNCVIGNPLLYLTTLVFGVVSFILMDNSDQKEWKSSFFFCMVMGTVLMQMFPIKAGILLWIIMLCIGGYHKCNLQSSCKKAEKLIRILIWCGLFLIALQLGLQRIWLSDYSPINGDFQNYNVWRRLLLGQIPQKDFAAYLGMGHLYVGGLFTYLAGGSLTDSMFASNILTSVCCMLFVYMMLYLIIGSRLYALVMTSTVSLSVVLNAGWYQRLYSEIQYPLSCIANRAYDSMRMLRSFIVVVVVVIAKKLFERWDNISSRERKIRMIGLSLLSGAAITYSNDVGVSSYLSFSFLFFICLVIQYGRNLQRVIIETFRYIGWSVIGFIAALTLFSRGHLFICLREMFGTASYQKWYYGLEITGEFVNIRELYFNKYAVIGITIVLFNILKMVQKRQEGIKGIFRYAAIAYMLLTAYISASFYLIQSGYSNHAFFYLLLFAAVMGYLVRGILYVVPKLRLLKIRRALAVLTAGILLCTTLPIANENMRRLLGPREGVYFPVMEGYLQERSKDVADSIAYVGEDSVFSTYASALEVETNRYQPTGHDYIIHALGDRQQKEYLSVFREGNYKKVQTIDPQYDFGVWMMNANWFFYKEVFRNYEKTFRTSYSQFWEKAEEPQIITDCNIRMEEERFSDEVVRIHFYADKAVDALLDVSIAYESRMTKSFWETGNVNLYTQVRDEFLQQAFPDRVDVPYFIQNRMEDRHIPVLLRDGFGSVVFTTYPLDESEIVLKNVEVKEVLKNPIEFPEVQQAVQ